MRDEDVIPDGVRLQSQPGISESGNRRSKREAPGTFESCQGDFNVMKVHELSSS